MAKLLIHVPHAATDIPNDVWPEFVAPRDEVEQEALASADLHTDRMAREAWPWAEIVEAQVSRIVVDVERYDDDSKEEMAKVGRGVLYTCDHQARQIRHDVPSSRREELLDRFYRPHWQRLRSLATGAILVDLHTYPAEPWPIEHHAYGAPRPEIDIGFSEGLTPPGWVEALTDHFQGLGYEVGLNTPYIGVIDAGAKAAVMIEIRRDVVGLPGPAPQWLRLVAALNSMPLGE
jgi:N-formylglutamate amidohydrolase